MRRADAAWSTTAIFPDLPRSCCRLIFIQRSRFCGRVMSSKGFSNSGLSSTSNSDDSEAGSGQLRTRKERGSTECDGSGSASVQCYDLQDPAKLLPVELLTRIFEYSVPKDVKDVIHNRFIAPLQLTHVSRHWRSCAHSAASLWTSLALYDVHNTVPSDMALIHSWLERSGNKPLDLLLTHEDEPDSLFTFDDLSDDVESIVKNTNDLIGHVSAYSDRWSTLDLYLVLPCLMPSVWRGAQGKLFRLRSLVIYTEHRHSNPESPIPHSLFAAPKLQELTLCEETYSLLFNNGIRESSSFSSLSFLNLKCEAKMHYAYIMQQCRSLTRLKITIWTPSWAHWKFGGGILPNLALPLPALEHLIALDVEIFHLPLLDDVFSLLRSPKLRKLRITCWDTREALDLTGDYFADFLRSAPIEDLTINCGSNEPVHAGGSQMASILRQVPRMRRLAVNKLMFDDILLEALTATPGRETLVPDLEEFHAIGNMKDDRGRYRYTEDSLVNTILSRSRHPQLAGKNMLEEALPPKSLRLVTLDLFPELSKGNVQKLEDLRLSEVRVEFITDSTMLHD